MEPSGTQQKMMKSFTLKEGADCPNIDSTLRHKLSDRDLEEEHGDPSNDETDDVWEQKGT